MKIWILDDLHGKEIYQDLKDMLPCYTYPIKKDVLDPLPYLKKIKDEDIVLLDNYFDGRDCPLGDTFLGEYLKLGFNYKIVSISDFGEKLIGMFDNWSKVNEKGNIVGWVTSKKGKDIGKFLKSYLNTIK